MGIRWISISEISIHYTSRKPKGGGRILGVQDSTVYYSVVCGHPLGDRELGLTPVIGTWTPVRGFTVCRERTASDSESDPAADTVGCALCV